MDWVETIGLGAAAFIGINLDDLLVTTSFFLEGRISAKSVVLGKYIGLLLLVGVSLAGQAFRLLFALGVDRTAWRCADWIGHSAVDRRQ